MKSQTVNLSKFKKYQNLKTQKKNKKIQKTFKSLIFTTEKRIFSNLKKIIQISITKKKNTNFKNPISKHKKKNCFLNSKNNEINKKKIK